MDKTPIIFIHFNDSGYLEYTLKSAQKYNPEKRIILLGDHTNEYYKKIGIEHYYFKNFSRGPEIELFDRVYKFIAGSAQRKKPWTNFVFKRWFYMYNFVINQNIESFWTFDSDTLVFTNLKKHEDRLQSIDCTTQCNGSCMNGYIKNIEIVKKYLDKINKLFQTEDYLSKQQKSLEANPDWAFTEMRAFDTFKEEDTPKTCRLNEVVSDEVFDECICEENDMEMEYNKEANKTIKKLYYENGKIYTKNKTTGKLVRLNTLNMSWVPTLFISNVYYYAVNGKQHSFYWKYVYYLKKIVRYIRRIILSNKA